MRMNSTLSHSHRPVAYAKPEIMKIAKVAMVWTITQQLFHFLMNFTGHVSCTTVCANQKTRPSLWCEPLPMQNAPKQGIAEK